MVRFTDAFLHRSFFKCGLHSTHITGGGEGKCSNRSQHASYSESSCSRRVECVAFSSCTRRVQHAKSGFFSTECQHLCTPFGSSNVEPHKRVFPKVGSVVTDHSRGELLRDIFSDETKQFRNYSEDLVGAVEHNVSTCNNTQRRWLHIRRKEN